MTPLEKLASMDRTFKRAKYPNMPDHALPSSRYRDNTANALTKAILRFLEIKGHMCWRQSSEGRYRPGQQVTDVIGRVRHMKGIWLPGQNNGAADVCAIINGRFTAIEVKVKDMQSEDQKHYQHQVEDSGGAYLICRSFADFHEWYNQITNG